ncbi:MAG: HD domain-containing protein [Candidatus Aminicenantes bacterium]|nr:HD domain-containing protein [Candidatus Aminicenantes bacterium]
MKEKINKLFSQQLEKIKDPDLREKVVEIWVNAAKKAGWQPHELEKIPFTLLTQTKGINLIEHTIAVTEGALGLANAIKENYKEMPFEINFDWLIAGGLLHDVGKLLEIEKTEEGKYQKSYQGKCARHPISGAILVAQAGLPKEIINIVACHAKEGEGRPKRVETVLIHQADFAVFDPMVMLEKGQLIV